MMMQVPVLWDKKTQKIVSNESADIIRMFATAFGEFQRSGDCAHHHVCSVHRAPKVTTECITCQNKR